PVGIVQRIAAPPLIIRRQRIDLIRDALVEEELRGELVARGWPVEDANLAVDMHGAALIPAGKNGLEAHGPVAVCGLISAQEFLAQRVVRRLVRVNSLRIAMPDIDVDTGERHQRAIRYLLQVDVQTQGQA